MRFKKDMPKNTSILEAGESNDIFAAFTEYGVHGNRIMTEDDDWLNSLMVHTCLFFPCTLIVWLQFICHCSSVTDTKWIIW